MKLLLENGAEVNAEGGEYGSALQAASFGGEQAIVKLLLKNGAEVNAEAGIYGSAIKKLLIENGAEVIPDGDE